MPPPDVETAELWAIPRLSEARRVALRDAWAAFWSSRTVVWAAAIVAILIFGWATDVAVRLDPYGITRPFHDNDFANLLVAPGARFDSAWYVTIGHEGYDVGARPAFFPLLPALLSLVNGTVGLTLVTGILISCTCSLGALYLLHRLVALDFGLAHARTTVWLAAWFPGAIVLSAVYSESLFLLLSIGSLYSARLARWPLAGLLGALAATSRSGGVLLLVPLVVIYLWGPRADRQETSPAIGLRPRYRPRPDFLWILLGVPAGLLLYVAYLALATGDPLSVFSAQAAWHRNFVPLGESQAACGAAYAAPWSFCCRESGGTCRRRAAAFRASGSTSVKSSSAASCWWASGSPTSPPAVSLRRTPPTPRPGSPYPSRFLPMGPHCCRCRGSSSCCFPSG